MTLTYKLFPWEQNIHLFLHPFCLLNNLFNRHSVSPIYEVVSIASTDLGQNRSRDIDMAQTGGGVIFTKH